MVDVSVGPQPDIPLGGPKPINEPAEDRVPDSARAPRGGATPEGGAAAAEVPTSARSTYPPRTRAVTRSVAVQEATDEVANLSRRAELLRNLGLYAKEVSLGIALQDITFMEYAYAAIISHPQSRSEGEKGIIVRNTFEEALL